MKTKIWKHLISKWTKHCIMDKDELRLLSNVGSWSDLFICFAYSKSDSWKQKNISLHQILKLTTLEQSWDFKFIWLRCTDVHFEIFTWYWHVSGCFHLILGNELLLTRSGRGEKLLGKERNFWVFGGTKLLKPINSQLNFKTKHFNRFKTVTLSYQNKSSGISDKSSTRIIKY